MPILMKMNYTENQIGYHVVDGAIKVHRSLGPGLLEKAYESCLAYELNERGLLVQRQKEMPLMYQGVKMGTGYKVDLMINEKVILEIKTVEALLPVHEAQLLTYLRLSGCKLGYLLNFYVPLMREGINRYVNRL